MFVDHIRIFAKAGDGGDGSASFRREKYVPKGGPDGGDGGDGGDIVLLVDPHTDNLKTFFYKSQHKAPAGVHGMRHKKHGKNGKTIVLKVPPGTLVHREVPAVETPDEGDGADGTEAPDLDPAGSPHMPEGDGDAGTRRELVADLTEIGERFVLCEGGIGGKGNVHFKSATNQVPHETTPGTPGEEGHFYLELRRIADAGLVGFPNAGKSTLLSKLSHAQPKIAAYPFTTLKPMVGVLEFSDFRRATLADIPGLIEGAHQNVGLGHDFLRHIWRCRLLIFVIDIAGSEGREPVEDLAKLRTEISLYDDELARRPWLVVANKMDLEGSGEKLASFRTRFPKTEVIPISAESGEGLDALRARLEELIAHLPD